jgi:hypothetical protein
MMPEILTLVPAVSFSITFSSIGEVILIYFTSIGSWLKNPLPPPLDERKGIEGIFRGA